MIDALIEATNFDGEAIAGVAQSDRAEANDVDFADPRFVSRGGFDPFTLNEQAP